MKLHIPVLCALIFCLIALILALFSGAGCSGETIYKTEYTPFHNEVDILFTSDMWGGGSHFNVGMADHSIQYVSAVHMRYLDQSGEYSDWIDIANYVYNDRAVAIPQNYLFLHNRGAAGYYLPDEIWIRIVWTSPEEGK